MRIRAFLGRCAFRDVGREEARPCDSHGLLRRRCGGAGIATTRWRGALGWKKERSGTGDVDASEAETPKDTANACFREVALGKRKGEGQRV